MQDRLFDANVYTPTLEVEFRPPHDPAWRNRSGAISEHMAIAELLDRGYKVAVPVVDDDGVDLVVNYRTTVQVKSARIGLYSNSWSFSVGGCYYSKTGEPTYFRSNHADIYLCHAPVASAWWIVPSRWLLEAGLPENAMGFSLVIEQTRKSKYAHLSSLCLHAWHLLDGRF